jgi:hypothetical protein
MGLADEIRLKIDRGELPSASAPKFWAAYGNGKPCSACGEPIPTAQIRWQLDDATVLDATFRFHIGCDADIDAALAILWRLASLSQVTERLW